ncbi:MAG: zf-TFIIB domain-containing protein [Planctomycetaceae bacterium]
MKNSKICPRCEGVLTPDSHGFTCPGCAGRFVSKTTIDPKWLSNPESPPDALPLTCTHCGSVMTPRILGTAEIDVCPQCSGVWLDQGETLSLADRAGLQQFLLYSLSLPERVVRSSIGLAAGAAIETAGLLVPQSFQSARTYELVVKNSLGFLTKNVGGVESVAKTGEVVPAFSDDFMARKAVGNFVDLAGMATLHVSPVWLLAIVSDVAYGSSSYVQELASELKEQGLIDDTSTIHHVDDVLTAIQDSSGNAASLFDTPPLSVDQLKATLDKTRESLRDVNYSGILPESELRRYWQEMQEISAKNGVSLLGVSGAVAMNTLGRLETVAKGTLTGVRVAGGLLNRHVIGHYTQSLQTISDKGLYESLRDTSGPYIAAVWNNFADDKPTWTEELVSGRLVAKGWKAVTGMLRASVDDSTDDGSPAI